MTSDKKTLIPPLLMITIGTGWLLSTLQIASNIDWAWTLGLAAVGVLTFVVAGCDKVTIVIGPFFLITSVLSVLRQTDRIRIDVEIPILVIVLGALLLIARSRRIPIPSWIIEEEPARKDREEE